jgi:UDP-glucose 4-epimerase
MKVLVTGAAGFIGTHLCARLAADGHQVVAADLPLAGRDVVSFDIADPVATLEALRWQKPEVVVHLAGNGDVQASWGDPAWDAKVNYVGSLNVYAAARAAGVSRMVFPSTWLTYERGYPVPTDERVPLRPTTPYGASKAAATHALMALAREQDPQVTVLVLGNVYGPGGDNVVRSFVRKALADDEPQRYPCARDFVHVDDVVDALVRAVVAEDGNWTLNVASGTPTSMEALWQLVAVVCGRDELTLGSEVEVKDVVALDCSRAFGVLGWRPTVKLPEGIESVLARELQE